MNSFIFPPLTARLRPRPSSKVMPDYSITLLFAVADNRRE